MPTTKPTLPTRKAAQGQGNAKKAAPAGGKELPFLAPQFITLEDGTQIPVKIPPGMPADAARGIIEYLKANPEAAKAAWGQAQSMLKTPGLANAFLNMRQQPQIDDPKVLEALRDDPELKPVFDEVAAEGPSALQKYWEDTELMSKISAKLRSMKLQEQETAAAAAAGGAPKASQAPKKPQNISNLHDAAKWGDVDVAHKMLNEGADVNQKNDRGITPLGVAVGFNRVEVVQLLLDSGADLSLVDGQGNTVLHYAAGYGRKEVAELLLASGAAMDATNKAGQKAQDVAKLNGEAHMVEFLKEKAALTGAAV